MHSQTVETKTITLAELLTANEHAFDGLQTYTILTALRDALTISKDINNSHISSAEVGGSCVGKIIAGEHIRNNLLQLFMGYMRVNTLVIPPTDTEQRVSKFLRTALLHQPNIDIYLNVRNSKNHEDLVSSAETFFYLIKSKCALHRVDLHIELFTHPNGMPFLQITHDPLSHTGGINIIFKPDLGVKEARSHISSRHDALRGIPLHVNEGNMTASITIDANRQKAFNGTDRLFFLDERTEKTTSIEAGLKSFTRVLRLNARFPTANNQETLLPKEELTKFCERFKASKKENSISLSDQTTIAQECVLAFLYAPAEFIATIEFLHEQLGDIRVIFPFLPYENILNQKEYLIQTLQPIKRIYKSEKPDVFLEDVIRKLIQPIDYESKLVDTYGDQVDMLLRISRSPSTTVNAVIEQLFSSDAVESISWWMYDFWSLAYLYLMFSIKKL